MPFNIIALAMTMMKHRDSIAKIVAVLPDLKAIFAELSPDQSPPIEDSHGGYTVGSMEWLQDSLNTLMDAGLEVDGDYGAATNAAVRDYQEAHGLVVDGWAGTATVSSIIEELSKHGG